MVAHILMDYAEFQDLCQEILWDKTRHVGDTKGSGISLTRGKLHGKNRAIRRQWLLPGGALERKLNMMQRSDPQPGMDKQKMSKPDP